MTKEQYISCLANVVLLLWMHVNRTRSHIYLLVRVKKTVGEYWAGSWRVCTMPIIKCLRDMFSVLRKTAGIMKVHNEKNGNGMGEEGEKEKHVERRNYERSWKRTM